jgi:peptidoglycan/xylan/chitin deacetylase (PgdA/CDA1 family)
MRRFRPLILCYHAVSEEWAHYLSVAPSMLERQLNSFLRRGYRPVDLEDALANGRRLFHVTFDDALRSVSAALPILDRVGARGTVFACPEYAQQGRPLDIPELAAEARAHPRELETMTWDELRGLVDRGVEIGSHSLKHRRLTQLEDDELQRDLRDSKDWLESELGRPCRFLAYPYGDDDPRVHAAAEAAGYEAAFASPGHEFPSSRFALPRVGIWRSDGPLRVAFKTSHVGRRATRRYQRIKGRL